MAMSTPAYSDSFNLGTITDNGTGDMTFAITNAFSGATFACTSGYVAGCCQSWNNGTNKGFSV